MSIHFLTINEKLIKINCYFMENNIETEQIEFEGFSCDNLKLEKHFKPKLKEMNSNSEITQNTKEKMI